MFHYRNREPILAGDPTSKHAAYGIIVIPFIVDNVWESDVSCPW